MFKFPKFGLYSIVIVAVVSLRNSSSSSRIMNPLNNQILIVFSTSSERDHVYGSRNVHDMLDKEKFLNIGYNISVRIQVFVQAS